MATASVFPAAPQPFPLFGFPISVGPFTYLADERDRLAALEWRHFGARQMGATVGAEIEGLDLTAPLADGAVAELRQALYAYKVLFFRDQPLTPAQHVAFAARFGELETHPFLPSTTGEPALVRFEKTAEVSGYENAWHHDVTWREVPSMGAVLHAVEVPPVGGDTLFSDMYAAYDALDEATRAEIDGLVAVHDFVQTFGHAMSAEQRAEARATYPPARHPVVCTHPGTGRPHLYVNRNFVSHVEGLDPDASRELIDRLCRRADAPEHQCRLVWEKDTVAFWDNRAVQHYASSDYWPHVRVMERASVVGTRPERVRP